MTEDEAIEIATSFMAEQLGMKLELIGAREPSKRKPEWTVLFKTMLPGGRPDDVVDGPTVVDVDPRSSKARFFVSL